MFVLVAPLLFIGFFSPANSETVNSESQKPKEHLISLRDYDFVGEDQRLVALLTERMAVLQTPLSLSELEGDSPAPEPAGPRPRVPFPFQPKPDYLHSNVRLPQIVNVSMDYAEYFNASDWLLKVNASFPVDSALRPGGPPAPGYVRTPASGTGWTPAPGPGRDFRRQNFENPGERENNQKILLIMKQCIYNAQRKMIELDPLVRKYERDPRFRIAFIYNRLNEWKHDVRTVYRAMTKYRPYPRRVKRVIWYYEHMLRLNIDITYSVETLVNLHVTFRKAYANMMQIGDHLGFSKLRKQQRKLKKMEALGLNTQAEGFSTITTLK